MPDTTAYAQPLIAAFAFGIVVNAALIVSLGLIARHGALLFRDGLRLALTAFSVASGLWGLFGFVSMNVASSSGCQASLAFAATFDQLARISFEQFLLWKTLPSSSLSFKSLIPQIILFVRLILAGVFVGFQRPQFLGVCVAHTLVLPIGITVLCIDTLLVVLFFSTLDWTGSALKETNRDWEIYRSRSIALSIAGFGLWTVFSVPLALGISSLSLLLRTGLPSLGLFILICIVAFFRDPLVFAQGDMTPEFLDGTSAREHRVPAQIHSLPQPGVLPTSGWDRSLSSNTNNNSEMKEKPTITTRPVERESSSSSFNVAGTAELEAGLWDVEKGRAAPQDIENIRVRPNVAQQPQDYQSHPASTSITSQNSPSGRSSIKHAVPVIVTTTTQPDEDAGVNKPVIGSRSVSMDIPSGRASWTPLEFAVHEELRQRSCSQPLYPAPLKASPFPTPLNISRSKTMNERGRVMPRNIPVRPDTWDLLEIPRGKRKRFTDTKEPSEVTQPSANLAARNIETLSTSLQPNQNDINRHTCASSAFTAWPGKTITTSESPPSISFEYFTNQGEGLPAAQGLQKVDNPHNVSDSKPLPPCPGQELPSQTNDFHLQLKLSPTGVSDKLTFFSAGDVAQILSASNGNGLISPTLPSNEHEHPRHVSATTNVINDESLAEYSSGLHIKSVVDRPRPVQRSMAQSRAADSQWPTQSSELPKRSSSCRSPGSLKPISRIPENGKIIMHSSALNESRESLQIHLDSRESMTVAEKMGMFFQVPAGDRVLSVDTKRKSRSLPELPETRSESGETTNQTKVHEQRACQEEKNARKISIDVSQHAGHRKQDRTSYASKHGLVSRYSAYLSPRPELPATCQVASPSPQRTSDVPSTIRGAWKEDDISTNWGSIHSAVNGISLEQVRAVEITQYRPSVTPRNGDQPVFHENDVNDDESLSSEEFILDQDFNESQEHLEERASERVAPAVTFPLWHYRVGDSCSTFTRRRHMLEDRRAPPPLPLDLTKPPKPLWIFAAEPSPLESPGHALEMLQEQLNKLEDDIKSVSHDGNQPDTGEDIDVSASRCDWQTMWNVVDVDSPSYAEYEAHFEETPEPLCIPSARSEKPDVGDKRSSHLTVVPASNLPSHSPRATKTTSLTVYQLRSDHFSSPTPPDSDDSDNGVLEVPLVYADNDVDSKKQSRWTVTAAPPSNSGGQARAGYPSGLGREKKYQLPFRKSAGAPGDRRFDLTDLESISTSYIPGDNLAL